MGDIPLSFHITGSVGMGISEKCSLPFVQEVVAATNYVRREHPHTATMIDIGGEDAKVVFFQDGQATDLRMNGNCAGGTGAFIDQMAILLGVSIDELNEWHFVPIRYTLSLHAAEYSAKRTYRI